MIAAVSIDNVAGAMGNIASVALIMALCDPRYSAFQYALLSAIALTPRYLLGGPAGWIADNAGWPMYYIVSVLLAMPGLLLVWSMREKIKQLDQPRT
jgi:PAT family beta-lactamase induction signal transducer AmpG